MISDANPEIDQREKAVATGNIPVIDASTGSETVKVERTSLQPVAETVGPIATAGASTDPEMMTPYTNGSTQLTNSNQSPSQPDAYRG